MVRPVFTLAVALALGACALPNAAKPGPADVKLRALAADGADTTADPLQLGLPGIHAVAALPDGGALLATEGGLWTYQADGTGKLLTDAKVRYAALVPDGTGAFLAFNRNEAIQKLPAEVHRVDADGKATLLASFGEGRVVRAVAPGPDGSVRALVLIVRHEGLNGPISGIEGTVWEAKAGAEPTQLRTLSAEDAQAIGVPTDEQATGVDAAGRFVMATGVRRHVERVSIAVGFPAGPAPTAAEPLVPAPTAMAVRLAPLDGGVEELAVDGHRAAIDGQGRVYGLDAVTGALSVRTDGGEPAVLLSPLPGPTFPREPGQELAFRAAQGAGGLVFLAPELGSLGSDGLQKSFYAPKATSLMRVAAGEATRVLGAIGGQQAPPAPGAFDLIEPAAGAPYFMGESAIAPDGRVALAELDHRIIRVITPGKGIKQYTWPEKLSLAALAIAPDGAPWLAYTDSGDKPAAFPANLLGAKDYDFNTYLGRLKADGTLERKATLIETKILGGTMIERIAVRANGSAFATRRSTADGASPELLHVATDGTIRSIWQAGDGRYSDSNGNYNTPNCSLGLAQDGTLEVVAGTQHARVAAGKSVATDLPDLPVNGAHPAVDPAGRLHVVTKGPTVTRVNDDGTATDVLAALFSPASLDYRLGTLDATGFDGAGNLFLVDRRQQRLFRVPAGRLPG